MRCDFQGRRQLALWFSGLTVAAAGWATQVDLWGQTALPSPAPSAAPTGAPLPVVPAAAPVPFNPTAAAQTPGPAFATPTPPGIPVVQTPSVPDQIPPEAIPGAGYPGGILEERYQMQAATQQWDQAAAELVQKYGQTKDEKARVALNQQLTDLVSKQFDRRQQFRERELKELEDKVAQLRSLHDRRTAAKGEIVRDRVNQLLRQADGLGWGGPEEEGGPTPFEARYGMGIGEVNSADPLNGMPSPFDAPPRVGVETRGDVDPVTGAPSADVVPPAAPGEPTGDR